MDRPCHRMSRLRIHLTSTFYEKETKHRSSTTQSVKMNFRIFRIVLSRPKGYHHMSQATQYEHHTVKALYTSKLTRL